MENTMLIVDDAKLNREILADLFREHFNIIKAEDGKKALEILKECSGKIDIVMLDLVMPEMSGFDVLKQRRELSYFCNVPVVVITGCGAMEDQVKAFELGANDYVTKPFEAEIVVSRVNSVIAAHQRMISVVKEAEKMKAKSEMDQMTGLLNKTTSENAINHISAEDDGKTNVLIVFDIDNFKSVNDLSGHQTGDHVICVVANLISGMFRKSDIVGRIGGDEFVALMIGVPNMEIVHEKLNRLMQTMKYKPNLSIPDNVSLSIGVASNEGKKSSYEELFQKADEALFRAKENGKACYREYGVEEIDVKDDKRPTALLISENRNICSTVHALIPNSIRIIDMAQLELDSCMESKDLEQLAVIYLDFSDIGDDGEEVWKIAEQLSWFDCSKIIAICQEGNLPQYMNAIKHGIADLLTAPMDTMAFKRRTNIQIK